ncbi:crystallin J1A-like [Clytia hemisphaerica]|uniref:Uncharacterized protein n=1 Tax=Clytia hemisphaerica TaxID=252671 RepID=A0A7M5XG13_9CNID|eukprot:TCONS_00018490-protein
MAPSQQQAKRSAQTIIGALVADAAVNPLHWNYNIEKLDEHLKEANGSPEFSKWNVSFYECEVGALSCYGDQAFTMLKHLVSNKGFDVEAYSKLICEDFGPNSAYKDPNPSNREDYPKKGPWLNSSVGQSLQNLKDGKYQEGADQNESDAHTKIIPLVAMYAGNPDLKKFVEQAVRTTLNNDRAVNAAVAYSELLESVILTGQLDISAWIGKLPDNHIKEEMNAVLQKKDDSNHRDVVKGFGIACSLPGNMQGSIHCLLQGKDYVESIRMTLAAGGGNCARSMAVAALLSARDNVDVPEAWIKRTKRGQEVLDLAKSLSELTK